MTKIAHSAHLTRYRVKKVDSKDRGLQAIAVIVTFDQETFVLVEI